MLLGFSRALALYHTGDMRARVLAKSLSCAQLFATPWNCSPPISLSMGFSRQEYWSGLPFPPSGDLPNSGMEAESPVSPALAGGFFTTDPSQADIPPWAALLASLSWNSSLSSVGPSFLAHSAVSSNLESASLTLDSNTSHNFS